MEAGEAVYRTKVHIRSLLQKMQIDFRPDVLHLHDITSDPWFLPIHGFRVVRKVWVMIYQSGDFCYCLPLISRPNKHKM